MSIAAALEASEAETEREDEVERSRLTMMRRYAEHTGCRRSFLLTYFGQDYPGPCGNCDNDLAHPQPARDRCRSFRRDRKSTRLNSSHANISYAVFCLKHKE